MKKTSLAFVLVLSGTMILSSCNKSNTPSGPVEYKLTFHQTEPGDIEDYVFTVIPGKTIQSDAWDVEPEINPKTGYTSEWDEYNVEEMTGDYTVSPIYTPIEYTATFVNRVNDEKLGTAKFTIESTSLTLPTLPTEKGYTYAWESYQITANNMTVYCDRTINQHTIKFYAEEEKTNLLATETFTIETESVNEPTVPAITGYDGEWPEYDLTGDQDIELVPVYELHKFYVQFVVNGENYGKPVGYEVNDDYDSIEKPEVTIEGYTVSWPEEVTLTLSEKDDPQLINAIVTANTYIVSYEGTEETTSVTYNSAFTLLSPGSIYSWTLNDEEIPENGEHWLIASNVTLSKKVVINTRVIDFEDGENKVVSIFDNFETLEVVDDEGLDGSKALKASYTGTTNKDCHLSFNKDYLDLVFADSNIKALSFYAKGTLETNNFGHKTVDKQYVNNNSDIISCYERNATGYGITTEYKQFYLTRGVYSQMSANDWAIQYGVSGAADLYLDNFQVCTHDYYEFNQNSLERGYFEKNSDTAYYLRDSTTGQANFLLTTENANNNVSLDYEMFSDGHRAIKIDKTTNSTINFLLRGDYQYNKLPDEGILFDLYVTSNFNGWWENQETGAIADGYDKHFVDTVNKSIEKDRWHTFHFTKSHINNNGGSFLRIKGSTTAVIYIDNIRLANNYLEESFESAKTALFGEYGYVSGFDILDDNAGKVCRDATKNYYFMNAWDTCNSIEVTSEKASHGSQSIKINKKSNGTFHIEPQWVALMDDDSAISFDIYTDDASRLSFDTTGSSARKIEIEKSVWNTVTLKKADFENNNGRFTQNAFGEGTFYIDNLQFEF